MTGDTVNVAARLEQAADAGEILLGDLTYRLVRNAVEAEAVEPLALKGKAEQVPAHRLLGLRDQAPRARRDTPLIGRETELDALMKSFEDAQASSRCRLATVLGAAGMGKSRLVDEFVEQTRRQVTVARGRCLSHGRGVTYLADHRDRAGSGGDPRRRCARS